ncbi:hypothetical protein VMCG_04832 [Cytospora schulzeri]|uniref:C2H2-type domain-containing protein n=1 Tax=Cytospora schulzeri TaxID=448051 RepID=A0A423WMT6_9PEZI|nr:hypothetical protein VMCG_04832 [Valsa malicola]
MGKKKRSHPNIEELIDRPWCYYCERDFEDLKLLISHQKAKHFKCDRCGRRLNTAGGLSVHMNQVHKESLSHVENALPNRQGLDVEVFGMEGVPEDIKEQHKQRIVQNYWAAQDERFKATGNPPPGQGRPSKKIKIETPEELKKRFADFRAKKAAAKAAGTNGTAIPPPVTVPNVQTVQAVQSPAQSGSPSTFNSPFAPPQPYGQPAYPNYPPNGAPPPGAGFNPYPPSALPARPPSLPTAPNLPQRPGYPAGNYYPGPGQPGASTVDELVAGAARHGDDIDHLIRMAEAGIRPAKTPTDGTAAAPPAADGGEKKSKKEKGRMVYGDTDFSPEERMAMMSKYAWTPQASA